MDNAVFVDLMVELAGLEEELLEFRGRQAARARRLREMTLRREIDEESAQVANEASQAAAAGYRGSAAELRDVEARLAHKKEQLIGVTDRRQYRALQKEIAGLEQSLDELETTALEYLEQPDPAASVPAASSPEQGAERDQLKAAQKKDALAEEEILGEIERLISMVPAGHAGHLQRLRGQYLQSVVRVADRSCGGCGGQLPHQQALDAANGKAAVRCPSCARFVVRLSYK